MRTAGGGDGIGGGEVIVGDVGDGVAGITGVGLTGVGATGEVTSEGTAILGATDVVGLNVVYGG